MTKANKSPQIPDSAMLRDVEEFLIQNPYPGSDHHQKLFDAKFQWNRLIFSP